MNSKAVVVGVVILVVIVAVILLSGLSEQPVEKPTVQQPSAAPSQPSVDPYALCVDHALKEAEDCLLSGGSDCKANGEKALDACKKLQ